MLNNNTKAVDQIKQLDNLESKGGFQEFNEKLQEIDLFPLIAEGISVLQINVGFRCNQACRHCHVNAGPNRSEQMTKGTFKQCLRVLEDGKIPTVDITGGAPELNPYFRWFVHEVRKLGIGVIDRCNLTIVHESGQEGLIDFLVENEVSVVASLPAISAPQTDSQRGKNSFEKSISALKLFNQVGYGIENSGLEINLVTNPLGAFLPGSQDSLEMYWRRVLHDKYNVKFNHLYTITNMPVGRFLEWLKSRNLLENYMKKLTDSFNPAAANSVMCKSTLSVDWLGYMYDCDFNQMLGLRINHGVPVHISDFDSEKLTQREIVTKLHCFGCTAGKGSSCGGGVV